MNKGKKARRWLEWWGALGNWLGSREEEVERQDGPRKLLSISKPEKFRLSLEYTRKPLSLLGLENRIKMVFRLI
jgi:hypothetical protein